MNEHLDTPDAHLNARGLICPEPVLRAGQQLRRLTSGQLLEVLADDPLAELDFQVFCDQTGHSLVSMVRIEPSTIRVLIRRR
ncbi:MAG: sulfurtransferase TusA family protein [Pseudomonadota bacterium]